MAIEYVTGSLAVIEEIIRVGNEARGLPRIGEHRGGGKHVEMLPADNDSPGWSRTQWPMMRNPIDTDEYVTIVDELFETISVSRLSGPATASYAQRTETPPADWSDHVPTHVTLPPTAAAAMTKRRPRGN